jgi:hypothetical protein
MKIRLAALLALTSVASADPLPCGDAPSPHPPAVAPDPVGIDHAAIAQTADGAVVVTLASHAVYKLATPTVARATWGFVERGGRFATIGVIAKDESVASPGRGTIVVGRSACTPGGHATIPAPPGDLVASRVDGHTLTAISTETVPRGAGCTGRMAGTMIGRLRVDRIDVGDPRAAWTPVSSHAIAPAPGSGCRLITISHAEVAGDEAAVVVSTCSYGDAGDSGTVADCALRVEHLAAGRWEATKIPFAGRVPEPAIVSVTGGATRVAVHDPASDRVSVYRIAGGSATREGDTIPGWPVAMRGGELVVVDAKGTPGGAGVGFRYQLHRLDRGAWAPAGDVIDAPVRSGEVAFAWLAGGVVAAIPDEDRTTVRVLRAGATAWKLLATLYAPAIP